MGKQGKMSHSPFHVESAQYKYAIEHENDDIKSNAKTINCQFYSHTGNRCTKWNSGTQNCKAFKCLYYKHLQRKNVTCADCGFFMGNKCFFPDRPSGIAFALSEASRCGVFLGEKANPSRYAKAKKMCKRVYLAENIKSSTRRVLDLKRSIRNLTKLMQMENVVEADIKRWSILRESQAQELEQLQDKLITLKKKQAKLGKPLKSIPHSFVR